jgi:SpoIIAA-like
MLRLSGKFPNHLINNYMKVFEVKNGVVEYDPSVPCVIIRFNGYMSSSEFRTFLTKGLDFLLSEMKKKNKEILWLADTRAHSVQSEEDTKWVSEVWNPKAYQGGLRHVAFVLPEKVFGQLAINNYAKNNDQNKQSQMKIKMFDQLERAKMWFREVKKQELV